MTGGSRILRLGKACLVAILLFSGSAFAQPGFRGQYKAPIPLGVGGSNKNDFATQVVFGENLKFCCGGTLGSQVTIVDGNITKKYILSNNHVLARTNVAAPGEAIIHRALIDTTPKCSLNGVIDPVATFFKAYPLDFAGGDNLVDAAIAEVAPGKVDAFGTILQIGPVNPPILEPAVGMQVLKSGRTTGYTSGSITQAPASITDVEVTVDIPYEAAGCGSCQPACPLTPPPPPIPRPACVDQPKCQTAHFVHQFRIGPAGFSDHGDSGSLIVVNRLVPQTPALPKVRPVGLLFAGSATSTLANPISKVLELLKITSFTTNSAYPVAKQFEGQQQAERPTESREQERLTAAARVKDRYSEQLLRLPDVVGHGIGLSSSGEPVIRIYLRKANEVTRRALPRSFEGVPVEIEETGEFYPLSGCASAGRLLDK